MDRVWIVESGEYEQRAVLFAAASRATAIAHLVSTVYADPYKVAWSLGPIAEDGGVILTGAFEPVPGLATAHTSHFDIRPEPLVADA